MVQAQRKHEKINGHDKSDVSEAHLPPTLAELAMRTLAAIATFSDKRAELRAAEDEFCAAKRTIAAAEQAASAPDWSDLGPKVVAISEATERRDTAAAAIVVLTKQVDEMEQEISALQRTLCKAAGDYLNPMRAAAAANFRDAAIQLKVFRDQYVALSTAMDSDLALLTRVMNVHVSDLETGSDLLYSRQVPDCPPFLATVRRAIREARLAHRR